MVTITPHHHRTENNFIYDAIGGFFRADILDGIREISSRGGIEQHEFSYSDVKKKRMGPPDNFRQATLHKYLLGLEPSSSHSAEADCLSLMRITAALGSDWTDWVRNNASVIEE